MSKKIIDSIYDSNGGFLTKYKRIRVGDAGWLSLAGLELVTILFGNLPGAPGLFLRGKLYRPFFKSIGRGVVFGIGVSIRNPGAIRLGDNVIIDDYALLDAKGAEAGKEIRIGSRVFVSRNVILGCKNGSIKIGDGVTLGPNTIVHAIDDSRVSIGDYTVIAANCYIVGAPNYRTERTDIPMAKQGFLPGKGITIASDVWLGASVTVLDGSKIGRGAIVGAMALVRGELPEFSQSHGIPAKVRSFRAGGEPRIDTKVNEA
jgi:acetyltransferase-like isoleucine patch superfamily enzyme